MTEILKFLIEHCPFLYAPGRFRFVDSQTSDSFGGDAYLTMESDRLRIQFVRDRAQLVMTFQNLDAKPGRPQGSYSIDLVYQLVTGETASTAELSPRYAAFLQEHIDDIERRFSEPAWSETKHELDLLARARAKELFG